MNKKLLTVMLWLSLVSSTFPQSITVTRGVAVGVVKWTTINLNNEEVKVPVATIPMDGENPCRVANGKIWDLRPQIAYYKNHRDIYGDFYEQTKDGWQKTDSTPPRQYFYKNSQSDTNWSQTNLTAKLSWFRISGWVSHIDKTNGNTLLSINTWDVIKRRTVPTYCLYNHPKVSQFKYEDTIDCLVYFSLTNTPHITQMDNIEYQSVQYGGIDLVSELSFVDVPKLTNTVTVPTPIVEVAREIIINNGNTSNQDHLNFNQNFTITTWINMSRSQPNMPQNILSTGMDEHYFNLRVVSNDRNFNGKDSIQVLFGVQNGMINISLDFTRNEWYQLAIVRMGKTVSLYRNGVLMGRTTKEVNNIQIGQPMTQGIHLHPSAKYPFKGEIKSVKTYQSALSPMEIRKVYTSELNSVK